MTVPRGLLNVMSAPTYSSVSESLKDCGRAEQVTRVRRQCGVVLRCLGVLVTCTSSQSHVLMSVRVEGNAKIVALHPNQLFLRIMQRCREYWFLNCKKCQYTKMNVVIGGLGARGEELADGVETR